MARILTGVHPSDLLGAGAPQICPRAPPSQTSSRVATRAAQIEKGPERLRVLAVADALMNLAEIKTLLLKYERRLLN
jgi:hypothetical protein